MLYHNILYVMVLYEITCYYIVYSMCICIYMYIYIYIYIRVGLYASTLEAERPQPPEIRFE